MCEGLTWWVVICRCAMLDVPVGRATGHLPEEVNNVVVVLVRKFDNRI